MSRDASIYRSLASMHRAGIPWPRALESAAGSDPRYVGVVRRLERGASVSDAFAGLVDPLDAALLAAGEQDGTLERTLGEMADAHEQATREQREGWVAVAYPLVLAHIAALLMPIPDLVKGHVGAALGWSLLILVPTWGFILWRVLRARRERPRPSAGASPPEPPPLVGPLRTRVEEADARGLEAFGRLLDAGVELDQTLELAVGAGWGGRAALDLDDARRRAQRGRDLAEAWTRLPEEVARRLRAGEESGSLGDAARRAAEGLRFDARLRRKRTAAIVPVVALLVVGGFIAWRIFRFYGDLYGNLPY